MIFTCDSCSFEIASWGDGNPYIEGPDGKRHHFYHPCEDEQIARIVETILGRVPTSNEIDEMLQQHCGNESNHICLDCGSRSLRNEKEAKVPCRDCGSTSVADAYHLAKKPCTACKAGTFDVGPPGAIS